MVGHVWLPSPNIIQDVSFPCEDSKECNFLATVSGLAG